MFRALTLLATLVVVSAFYNDTACFRRVMENPNLARCSGDILISQILGDMKNMLLQYHADARDAVKEGMVNGKAFPKATTIQHMKWNDELARQAQTYANTCPLNWDFDDCAEDLNLSQNIAASTFDVDVNDAVRNAFISWWNEASNYNSSHVNLFRLEDQKTAARFTRMVWENSTMMGCGIVVRRFRGVNYQHLVCNYAPKGNIVGERVYNTIKDDNFKPDINCKADVSGFVNTICNYLKIFLSCLGLTQRKN